MTKKILNLYAGIGGNRKLWDEIEGLEVDVTAVEIESEIAEVYRDYFPEDRVIEKDAHEFLRENYMDFDFIWSSPPCPSHSRTQYMSVFSEDERSGCHKRDAVFPDMRLYEEVIFLDTWFDGRFCVENVKSYYEPLIEPQEICRHYFWSNYFIPSLDGAGEVIEKIKINDRENELEVDLSDYSIQDKRKVLRNCVDPKIGKHILESAFTKRQKTLNEV